MTKKVYITSAEPKAQSKVYDVPSPALADEIVKYTIHESEADEIVYFTAFEERANKKVYVVNPDLYVDTYRHGVDSGNMYDNPESQTVQVWILMGVNLYDQEKYALALAVCRREGKPPFFLPPGPRGWHTKPSCAPPGGRNGADNQCFAPYFCSLRQTARML